MFCASVSDNESVSQLVGMGPIRMHVYSACCVININDLCNKILCASRNAHNQQQDNTPNIG